MRELAGAERWRRFRLVEGDVRDTATVREACLDAELVLHQAGAGSVPRSLAEPVRAVAVNTEGTWKLLAAARAAGAARVVLASSSSVYGDRDERAAGDLGAGNPLSPYAASKRAAELAAEGFARALALPTVALRYFNVFGPRQDPAGPYAAVIPRWCAALRTGEAPVLHGDGAQTRDFTPVAAIAAANLLAATAPLAEPFHVLDAGTGRELALADLLARLVRLAAAAGLAPRAPERASPRPHDRRTSRAELGPTRALLGYEPPPEIDTALRETWRAASAPAAR